MHLVFEMERIQLNVSMCEREYELFKVLATLSTSLRMYRKFTLKLKKTAKVWNTTHLIKKPSDPFLCTLKEELVAHSLTNFISQVGKKACFLTLDLLTLHLSLRRNFFKKTNKKKVCVSEQPQTHGRAWPHESVAASSKCYSWIKGGTKHCGRLQIPDPDASFGLSCRERERRKRRNCERTRGLKHLQ